MQLHNRQKRQARMDRRFRPGSALAPGSNGVGRESGLALETRVLLSARAGASVHEARAAVTHVPRVTHVTRDTHETSRRVTPATEITAQYSAFANDFATVEQLYVTALNEQATATTTVTATVTAPYTAGASTMQVSNASVFFPNGSTTPVTATATQGTFPIGSFYLTGFSGNMLFVSPSVSSPVDVSTGATLTATVSTSASTSAASIFPSFIVNRTNQMAIDLVQYFNSLPLRLPYLNAPPHTPNNRGAIQKYVYNSVAGTYSTASSGTSGSSSAQGVSALNGVGATSLQQQLLAIPLPTTSGSDLEIYDESVASAIQQSLTQTLNGVAQVNAGKLQVNAQIPNNRYGADVSGTVPSYITAQP